jgi:hypothetical protein
MAGQNVLTFLFLFLPYMLHNYLESSVEGGIDWLFYCLLVSRTDERKGVYRVLVGET